MSDKLQFVVTKTSTQFLTDGFNSTAEFLLNFIDKLKFVGRYSMSAIPIIG
jgi:hypothetical protein